MQAPKLRSWFGGRVGTRTSRTENSVRFSYSGYPAAATRRFSLAADSGTAFVIGLCSGDDDSILRALSNDTVDIASRWSGSYTIVRLYPRKLVISTNYSGSQTIFYGIDRRTEEIVYSCSALATAQELSTVRVNEEWLSSYLMCELAHPDLTTTPFQGVSAVPPGAELSVDERGVAVIQSGYQDQSNYSEDIFLGALEDSISCRLNAYKQVSCDMSGGLDSTTLSFLAHRFDKARLITSNWEPPGKQRAGDLTFVDIALSSSEFRHLPIVMGEDVLPYSRLDTIPLTDEPAPSATTVARVHRQFSFLKDAGSQAHMTGDGGDALLSSHPELLSDAVSIAKIPFLIREHNSWARALRLSPITLWKRTLEKYIRARLPFRSVGPTRQFGAPIPWLTKETTTRYRDSVARKQTDAVQDLTTSNIRAVARFAQAEEQLVRSYSIDLLNPYVDSRLLQIVLAAPADKRSTSSLAKPILQNSTIGVIPEPIRTRTSKGNFTRDEFVGIRQNWHHIQQMVNDSRLVARGYIDPDAVRDNLMEARSGVMVDIPGLNSIISAEYWLRALEQELG